jgi:hypothetical protein
MSDFRPSSPQCCHVPSSAQTESHYPRTTLSTSSWASPEMSCRLAPASRPPALAVLVVVAPLSGPARPRRTLCVGAFSVRRCYLTYAPQTQTQALTVPPAPPPHFDSFFPSVTSHRNLRQALLGCWRWWRRQLHHGLPWISRPGQGGRHEYVKRRLSFLPPLPALVPAH